MAKRQRPPEAVQKLIAQRFHKGDDPDDIANEYGIASSTVKDYAKRFPNNPRKVKRRVIPKQPTENTRVLKLEERVRELEAEKEIWQRAYNAAITNAK